MHSLASTPLQSRPPSALPMPSQPKQTSPATSAAATAAAVAAAQVASRLNNGGNSCSSSPFSSLMVPAYPAGPLESSTTQTATFPPPQRNAAIFTTYPDTGLCNADMKSQSESAECCSHRNSVQSMHFCPIIYATISDVHPHVVLPMYQEIMFCHWVLHEYLWYRSRQIKGHFCKSAPPDTNSC